MDLVGPDLEFAVELLQLQYYTSIPFWKAALTQLVWCNAYYFITEQYIHFNDPNS